MLNKWKCLEESQKRWLDGLLEVIQFSLWLKAGQLESISDCLLESWKLPKNGILKHFVFYPKFDLFGQLLREEFLAMSKLIVPNYNLQLLSLVLLSAKSRRNLSLLSFQIPSMLLQAALVVAKVHPIATSSQYKSSSCDISSYWSYDSISLVNPLLDFLQRLNFFTEPPFKKLGQKMDTVIQMWPSCC